MNTRVEDKDRGAGVGQSSAATISLPKGGGAIRGIGEKFATNPVTGTGSLSVPIPTSPGRSGFGPQLSLSYDSGAGNGPFGFGWNLSLPAITRKTDKGLPQYRDAAESDIFVLSGAEDLVPVLIEKNGLPQRAPFDRTVNHVEYSVQRYRPRVEGLFARIERWTRKRDGDVHWRSISKDNITTLYGKDPESRIAESTRIFSWLICESYDDKGNWIVYEYKQEDAEGVDPSRVEEKNRLAGSNFGNRYLKRIKYGNKDSRLLDPDQASPTWFFEVVFDYGEHYVEAAGGQPHLVDINGKTLKWTVRQDPFSSYRSGFEVRTYRICRRVLTFHHFPEELGTKDCLVRSTDFVYTEGPVASFIKSITQSSYVRNDRAYLKKSLPPLEFDYSPAHTDETIRDVDAASLGNLPRGLDGSIYEWVDLDGEGISGILTEQGDAWYYNRNNGGQFGPCELVMLRPSFGLRTGGAQFLDLAGDGQVDVVQVQGPVRGFFERTNTLGWSSFQAFSAWPNVDTSDPNTRFVDLNGDGHADLLITEDDAFAWHPALAEDGFGSVQRVSSELDEEKGPRLVFSEATQSIYLSDMSGDGLSDLVRIRNGEICYWPNLGYGKFGNKVTMGQAPCFDSPDLFDQKRVRLADIDGSGVTDIIYLGRDQVSFWFNESGNSWSLPRTLAEFPSIDNIASVTVVDLKGNGTASLVWSSPLPGAARRPMRYIDLMGRQKPHLLISVRNNLGAETKVHYSPSTKFYLDDKNHGRPWITRLPFPVHVVERVETYDFISRNLFVTRYAYHHGYFDGAEREFRGFGMVEQWDSEDLIQDEINDFPVGDNFDPSSHVPPVHTKTWFHTGAWVDGNRISKHFDHEYYRESDASANPAGLTREQLRSMLLDDTVLPATRRLHDGTHTDYLLSSAETMEACRSLKGSILRQEVYALDNTEEADRPYSASEHNYTIELLQPRAANGHAVFFTHARETVDFHYERKLFKVAGTILVNPNEPLPLDVKNSADPRVTHTLNLAVDTYGNVLQAAAIGYGRRLKDPSLTPKDQNTQAITHVTWTENTYTNPVLQDDNYRVPLVCDARTYELLKVTPAATAATVTNLFRFEEILEIANRAGDGRHDLGYEDITATGATEEHPYRRLIEHLRTLYRRDDLTDLHNGLLPLRTLEARALPGESYRLAFTSGLLAAVYRSETESLLPNPVAVLKIEGGYVPGDDLSVEELFPRTDPKELWWIPSGRVFLSDPKDTLARELDFAKEHFFLPHCFRDPFGNDTTIVYDHHKLLPIESADALLNKYTAGERKANGTITSGIDYRVLQPFLVTDPNGNRTEVMFDTLGMVAGTAVKGKDDTEGDSLNGFEPNLADSQIDEFYVAEDPHVPAQDLLRGATTRIVYDLDRFRRTREEHPEDLKQWLPAYTAMLGRETHVSGPLPPDGLKIQISFSYSDGFGREIQKKLQAEPGPLVEGGPLVNPRWVGSGWTIFNNKGKPVRKYEPFFSRLSRRRHHFEFGVTVGVSPVHFYDPLERVVATLHPNHTYEKVIFDPWQRASFDVNDTVALDPKTDPDVRGFFCRLPDSEYLPTWHQHRVTGALGAEEKSSAEKAAKHADTPSVAHLDTLGRIFLTIEDNGKDAGGDESKYPTRVLIDIEGNEREVRDAIIQAGDSQGRVVIRYDYDMLGNRIHEASVDVGERWMLNDISGQSIRKWDSRGHTFITTYDVLRRPTEMRVKGGEDHPLDNVYEKIIYGEDKSLNGKTDVLLNLRGRPFEHYDTAGKICFEEYDFKGNLLSSSRRLTSEYKNVVQWDVADAEPQLEHETFRTQTQYDALNRVTSATTPDGSITQHSYNDARLIETVKVDQEGSITRFVKEINYNEKGQRLDITYGNDIKTTYEYDRETFRLVLVQTRKKNGELLQYLRYTYDPVGNIVQVEDRARPTIFFGNMETRPVNEYTYDALYRLTVAKGREHIAQVDFGGEDNWHDLPFLKRYNIYDPMQWRDYTESYDYDQVGNIKQLNHVAPGGGWTRTYAYETINNRLRSTSVRTNGDFYEYQYEYHPRHGFITDMPHLETMEWNFRDELQAVARQRRTRGGTAETTYYVYDASGQRVRMITEAEANPGATPVRKQERIYLGRVEVYREHTGNNTGLKRATLHVMDDKQRVAMIETRNDIDDGSLKKLIRYQFSNHLGTACLEADDDARLISYEEYHPYGTTSYQAVDKSIKAAARRYRYSGKERDEESGLYYYGARYYASWLGRWISCDPAGAVDGTNLYRYVRNNPMAFGDKSGLKAETEVTEHPREHIVQERDAAGNPARESTTPRRRGYVTITAPEETGDPLTDFVSKLPSVTSMLRKLEKEIAQLVAESRLVKELEGWHSEQLDKARKRKLHEETEKQERRIAEDYAKDIGIPVRPKDNLKPVDIYSVAQGAQAADADELMKDPKTFDRVVQGAKREQDLQNWERRRRGEKPITRAEALSQTMQRIGLEDKFGVHPGATHDLTGPEVAEGLRRWSGLGLEGPPPAAYWDAARRARDAKTAEIHWDRVLKKYTQQLGM